MWTSTRHCVGRTFLTFRVVHTENPEGEGMSSVEKDGGS